MGIWAKLPYDLIALIAKHVKVIEDFIAFGAVCTSWQAAASKEIFDVLSPQLPLLMLPDKYDVNREFYSLSKKTVSRIFLPEVRGKECFPSEGWIFTVSSTLPSTGEMNLLHPFSRAQIQLPPENALLALCINSEEDPIIFRKITNVFLSASPSLTSDYVLVVSCSTNANSLLAFWRPGDLNWTCIDHDNDVKDIFSMINYKGQFYVVDNNTCQVWVFDIRGPIILQPIIKPHVLVSLQDGIFSEAVGLYLVELSGALLLVGRFSRKHEWKTIKFEVYELDVIKGELKEVTLGDSAIFLGLGGASSFDSSKFTGVKPNHIYFTDEWYFEKMAQGRCC